ncbi:MAG: tRNA lysidine(34) synthetase TilS [Phycisphaerales bacterium]|nr:tRNA lysidine(34) synthetase TilS [Phycisphaerales bacterium]
MNITEPDPARAGRRRSHAPPGLPSTRLRFVAAVATALDRRCGVRARDRLVLAVSGGADSMALLLAMAALAGRSHRRYNLAVAHVNHHLRPEADVEAQNVREASARLGLDCNLLDIHPRAAAGNLAEVCRRLRYEALAEVVRGSRAAGLITAHHGTDQLETLLMALMRGSGLDGLSALAWRAPRWGVDIIRPLLDQSHQDCIDLCRHCGWTWAEDLSNLDESKRRNAVRARLLPTVLELAPDLDRRIHRTADLMRQAAALVQREAVSAFTADEAGAFDRARLATSGELIIGAGLRDAAAALGARRDDLTLEVVRPAVDAIMQTQVRRPRRFDWPGGVVVEVRSRKVLLHIAAENR